MPNYLLLLAYRGDAVSAAWGTGAGTVQRRLADALERLGEPGVWPDLASRTDAGVHARGQVAQVVLGRSWAPEVLAARLTAHLQPAVVCWGAAAVPGGAVGRRLADAITGKTYRYGLDLAPAGDPAQPFLAGSTWRPPHGVTIAGLAAAAALIPGDLDSGGFHRRGEARAATRTRLAMVRVHALPGPRAVVAVRGDRFAYHLVRSLVGGLVAVARGAVTAAEWQAALGGAANRASGEQAPPQGLCLHRVHLDPALRWVRPATGG